MRVPSATKLLQLILLLSSTGTAATTSKRGLIHVPSPVYPEDDNIWFATREMGVKGAPPVGKSRLSWYYNYQALPSDSINPRREGSTQELQFMPMLWGDAKNNFVEDVKGLKNDGIDIE